MADIAAKVEELYQALEAAAQKGSFTSVNMAISSFQDDDDWGEEAERYQVEANLYEQYLADVAAGKFANSAQPENVAYEAEQYQKRLEYVRTQL
jgi:hypothetical protein